jgi:hypothetical protein
MVLVGLVMRPFHGMHASDIRHSHRDSSLQHRSIGRPTWQEARREYKDVCSGNDPSVASICVPQILLCTSFAASGHANNPSCRSQHLIGARATQGGTHKYGVIQRQHSLYPQRKGNGSERPVSIDKAALSFSFSSTAEPAGDRHIFDRSQMRRWTGHR